MKKIVSSSYHLQVCCSLFHNSHFPAFFFPLEVNDKKKTLLVQLPRNWNACMHLLPEDSPVVENLLTLETPFINM